MGAVIQIEFGAMAPKLMKQLKPYRIHANEVRFAQRMADGITLLKIHGVLSEVETRAAHRRLLQWIKERIEFGGI